MRVAVLFPAFLGGGAEAVCAWILEALKDLDVTLITLSSVDLRDLDTQYGTRLENSSIKIEKVSLPPFIGRRMVHSLSAFALRQFYLSWYYRKKFVGEFDIAFSAFNEMDLGKPGIQYIHLPMFGRGHEILRPLLGHPDSNVRRIYRETLRVISGWSDTRMRNNLTLTNSHWTANWTEKLYGIRPVVVYPPVRLPASTVPWQQRRDEFVLISRVVPEKKIERAIRILSEVRKAGFNIRLRIFSGIADDSYVKNLYQMFGKIEWVIWEKRLSRQEYEQVLPMHKFGIHPRDHEQFGIGVAEMVSAGVIPFVPDEGGQAEIVAHDPYLCWESEEEAVDKIIKVLEDRKLQKELRTRLSARSKLWTTENFVQQIRQNLHDFN